MEPRTLGTGSRAIALARHDSAARCMGNSEPGRRWQSRQDDRGRTVIRPMDGDKTCQNAVKCWRRDITPVSFDLGLRTANMSAMCARSATAASAAGPAWGSYPARALAPRSG